MGRDHLNCLVLSYTLGRWGSKKTQNRWYTVMPCWSVLLILLVVSNHLQHFLTIPLKTCIIKAFVLGPSSLTRNKTQIAVINILNLRILITWLFVRYPTYIFKSGIKTVTIFENYIWNVNKGSGNEIKNKCPHLQPLKWDKGSCLDQT